MKSFAYLLAISGVFISLTMAESESVPAWLNTDLTTDPNKFDLFIKEHYPEGTRLTIERFLDPLPAKYDEMHSQAVDFSKFQHYFCRDMPVVPLEEHPKFWRGGHLKVCWGVLEEADDEQKDA